MPSPDSLHCATMHPQGSCNPNRSDGDMQHAMQLAHLFNQENERVLKHPHSRCQARTLNVMQRRYTVNPGSHRSSPLSSISHEEVPHLGGCMQHQAPARSSGHPGRPGARAERIWSRVSVPEIPTCLLASPNPSAPCPSPAGMRRVHIRCRKAREDH